MKSKTKNGFTLVELLAVIVILAIILVIAVPKVMSVIEDSKKATLESTAKMIASSAEKQKVQNTVLGNDKVITCESITNINKEDYPSCNITFEDNTAKVTIVGGGKFEGLNVCGGTKTSAEATKEECKLTSPVLNCTFDGELSKGKEFIHGQYTYRYKQAYKFNMSTMVTGWEDIDQDGWGVILTNKSSKDPVNTPICSYINGKPLVSTSMMFVEVDMSNGILNVTNTTNIDVSSWDTGNVTNMMGMFAYSPVFEIKGLSSLEMNNVTNMMGMFFESSVNKIDLSGKDMRNVTNMSSIFSNNANLVLDLSNTNLNGLTDISNMFNGSILKTLNMSGANLSNVTNMSQMFKKSSIGTINMSNVNASKVTNITDIFDESEIINLDMSGANLSNVTDMSQMFAAFGVALFLKEGNVKSNVNLSEMDVRNVKSMQHMFDMAFINSIDMNNMKTDSLIDMSWMFFDSPIHKVNLTGINTSNVMNMESMFSLCGAVEIVGLNTFNTSKVTNMSDMFETTNATSLNLSSFDTSKVTDMSDMFSGTNATTIFVGNQWNTSNVESHSNMFTDATNLVGGNGTAYNSSCTDKTYARIDKEGEPGYFTYKGN